MRKKRHSEPGLKLRFCELGGKFPYVVNGSLAGISLTDVSSGYRAGQRPVAEQLDGVGGLCIIR